MHNPPHPGQTIKTTCLEALDLSVTEAAAHPAGISPDMAIRLEKAGWSNADFWVRLQAAYDLAQARQREGEINVERFKPA